MNSDDGKPPSFEFAGKVYIHGPDHGNFYLRMFENLGFIPARTLEEADVVCFTGGADVDPQLYGERALTMTHFDTRRDSEDIDVWAMVEDNPLVLKVGICRGAQFLNVMNGGTLWQDVNHHALTDGHKVLDTRTGQSWVVSSTHHQMMRPSKDGEILAWAVQATYKKSEKETLVGQKGDVGVDPEVVYYAETNSLCFQPHPEFPEFEECLEYFANLLYEHY